jgi:hypothetical protein
MSNPTSNFGWQMPTPTDLVTDLPADFEVFGQAVDTSMADLKGGTSGQVLAKNSNTDMDFVWTTANPGDITGVTAGTGISGGGTSGTVTITNSMATEITAKGDLIVGTGSAAFDNLAAGSNGETLVSDSAATTGLRYQGNYAAGKNIVLNSDFRIAQRGTSFTSPTSGSYTLDRWLLAFDGTGATRTITQQIFTPGTAPVAGYESANFIRCAQTVAGTSNTYVDFRQRIEDVRAFAGQTVTVSFWAKAAATQTITILADQDFGSGGSATVFNALPTSAVTLTTSWQRFTYSASVASISGKTIGTSSYLSLTLRITGGSTFTVDVFGVQMEAGSVATAFQTATGTLQGELAACRYYYRRTTGDATALYQTMANLGYTGGTTTIAYPIMFDTPMRTTPSSVEYANLRNSDGVSAPAVNSVVILTTLTNKFGIFLEVGTTGATAFRPYSLQGNNSATAYLGWSAEL